MLVNAIRDVNGTMITIGTSTGEQHQYPSVWLRDNCQCPKCFNMVMQSRTLDWKYFDINIKPTHVMVGHCLLTISFSVMNSKSVNSGSKY
jgi:hypothetical protein